DPRRQRPRRSVGGPARPEPDQVRLAARPRTDRRHLDRPRGAGPPGRTRALRVAAAPHPGRLQADAHPDPAQPGAERAGAAHGARHGAAAGRVPPHAPRRDVARAHPGPGVLGGGPHGRRADGAAGERRPRPTGL
ncbi:MAG: hypothetical protein AVDCRST_MAG66-819, partial [uncultured Pseudonocardia sp.]